MNNTNIEWTERTWNPITGCSKKSLGCQNCYAERMANRLHKMGNARYLNNFVVTVHPDLFDQPLKIRKPSMIFVCSMSDLFHDEVDFDILDQLFNIMKQASQHTFQVLTKRPERMSEYFKTRVVPDNVWVGTTIEHIDYSGRLKYLLSINANTKFLSCEPLLGSLSKLNLKGVSWVIVGGESGPKARILEKQWVIELLEQCENLKIPFFFKQWGGLKKAKTGNLLNGKVYHELPRK